MKRSMKANLGTENKDGGSESIHVSVRKNLEATRVNPGVTESK